MTNSSSLSNLRWLTVLLAAVSAAGALLPLIPGLPPAAALAALPPVAVLALLALRRVSRIERTLDGALQVCARGAVGDYDRRIIGIAEPGVLGDLLNRINDTLDLADCFVREAGAAMESASRKRYFRQVNSTGLTGAYRAVAETINRALLDMDRRDREVAETQRAIVELVGAASRGDFSRRLGAGSGSLAGLCTSIDELIATTQSALEAIESVLSGIAAGNLDHRVEADFEGTFGRMRDSTNAMAERLGAIVTNIEETSTEIGRTAAALTDGSRQLLENVEVQSSHLQRTAAAMEELTATVHSNADNAGHANGAMRRAEETARGAAPVAGDAVGAMRRIEGSARRINEVIGLIDEIAFQTNILALNAAVEAARAGDSGRGFAVVAQEVRTLAHRSAEASRDIRRLIEESGQHVSTGVDRVVAAGNSLQTILGSVETVARNIDEIAVACRQQAAGLNDINKAVEELDGMTQRNTELAGHSAGAARDLKDQAQRLDRLMAFFKVA